MILLVPVPSAVMRWRLSLLWAPLCSTAIAIIRLATNIMLVACTQHRASGLRSLKPRLWLSLTTAASFYGIRKV